MNALRNERNGFIPMLLTVADCRSEDWSSNTAALIGEDGYTAQHNTTQCNVSNTLLPRQARQRTDSTPGTRASGLGGTSLGSGEVIVPASSPESTHTQRRMSQAAHPTLAKAQSAVRTGEGDTRAAGPPLHLQLQ